MLTTCMTTSSIRPPFPSFSSISAASRRSGPASPGRRLRICVALYWLRIFAIGAGYHRYFSHRAYSTSRAFQFVLAFLSQTTAQKSVLWWAAKHRHHHLHSDTEHDVHSPRHNGFIYSHVGWIFSRKHDDPDLAKVIGSGALSRADVAAQIRAPAGHRSSPAFAFSSRAGPASSSASCGARCSSITPPSASIRSPMCAAASAT